MLLRAAHEKAPAPRLAPPRRVSAVAPPATQAEAPRARFGPDGTVHIDDSLMARYASFVDKPAATAPRAATHSSPPSLPTQAPSPQQQHRHTSQGTQSLARPVPLVAQPTLPLARPVPLASPLAAPRTASVSTPPTLQQHQHAGREQQRTTRHVLAERGVAPRLANTPLSLGRPLSSMDPAVENILQCVVALVVARVVNSWLGVRS
nr:hypothetical protein [Pandoravirus massiliensis]